VGLVRKLFTLVRYPLLKKLEISGVEWHRLMLPMPDEHDEEPWIEGWIHQTSGDMNLPSLTELKLFNCGPTYIIYFIFFCQMEELKELRLKNIKRGTQGRGSGTFDDATWTIWRNIPMATSLKSLEKLTLYHFPHELVTTLLSRMPLGKLRFSSIINNFGPRVSDLSNRELRGLSKSRDQIISVVGPIAYLGSLVKCEIKARFRDVERLLEVFPDELENLQSLGVRIITEHCGLDDQYNDPDSIPRKPSRNPIALPKLEYLILPDTKLWRIHFSPASPSCDLSSTWG